MCMYMYIYVTGNMRWERQIFRILLLKTFKKWEIYINNRMDNVIYLLSISRHYFYLRMEYLTLYVFVFVRIYIYIYVDIFIAYWIFYLAGRIC